MSHVQTGRCAIQRDRQRRQSHVPVAPKLSYRRVAQFPMKGRLTLQDTCSASDCDKSKMAIPSWSTLVSAIMTLSKTTVVLSNGLCVKHADAQFCRVFLGQATCTNCDLVTIGAELISRNGVFDKSLSCRPEGCNNKIKSSEMGVLLWWGSEATEKKESTA